MNGFLSMRTRTLSAPRRAVRAVGVLALLAVPLTACGSDDPGATTAALNPQVIDKGSLTICTSFPYKPFEFHEAGKPAGFDIDLADEVAKKLELEPVIVNASFGAIESGKVLNENKCDVAVAAMTINGDRARVLDFSSPYFDAGQSMVVAKGSGISSLDDLSGKSIGVQKETTGELYVTDNAPTDADIVAYETAGDVEAALADGDVAAAVYDNTVVGDVVDRNPDFEVAAQFDTGEQYGMAVKKNGSIDLLRVINNVLADLKSDGGYDDIYAKWFGDTKK